jgi:ABC-type transport system substrate-binding protein
MMAFPGLLIWQRANWHDGEKFTSKDVKIQYELFLTEQEGSYYGAYLSGIESIDVS